MRVELGPPRYRHLLLQPMFIHIQDTIHEVEVSSFKMRTQSGFVSQAQVNIHSVLSFISCCCDKLRGRQLQGERNCITIPGDPSITLGKARQREPEQLVVLHPQSKAENNGLLHAKLGGPCRQMNQKSGA